MLKRLLFIALPLLMMTVEARAMVTWDWDGTNLNGAGNVDVNGTLYDVKFMDGTCVDLFSGCDNAIDDFAFTTPGDADDAAQALLDQVLLDLPPPGIFDIIPWATAGCSINGTTTCTIYVPHTIPVGGISVVALAGALNTTGLDLTVTDSKFITDDLTGVTDEVYAIFTKTAVVPIPAAFWLFGTALLGLVGFSKRRKVAA